MGNDIANGEALSSETTRPPWRDAVEPRRLSSVRPWALRHREDRRPVAFLTTFVAYQYFVYALVPDPVSALVLVMVPHAVLHVGLMNVMHFSVHQPIFRGQRFERVAGVLWSLALGFTRSCFRHDHLEHHRHYLDPERDSNQHLEEGPLRRQRYALRQMLTVYPRSWRIAQRGGRSARLEFLAEGTIVLLILAALVLAKPGVALAAFAAPMLYNMFAVYYWSHHQHAGLQSTDALLASRTFENRAFNWLAFNVGYHAAHHHSPGVHWSKLPGLHLELRSRIPVALVLRRIPWIASDYPH